MFAADGGNSSVGRVQPSQIPRWVGI